MQVLRVPWRPSLIIVMVMAVIAAGIALTPSPAHGAGSNVYLVTIENLTASQPFTPPVIATHLSTVHALEVGEAASDEVAAIAQGGDGGPLTTLLEGMIGSGITDVASNGAPIVPAGSSAGGFSDTAQVRITGDPGDVISLVGMLICTNDGLVAADSLALPTSAPVSYDINGYDAGREMNTELSDDIVDGCSALGPVALDGDDNGNDDMDAEVDVIRLHPGVTGTAGGLSATHAWTDPVATVTIEPVTTAYALHLVNNATSQPFSPPVFASHSTDIHILEVGAAASTEVAAVAQDGDPGPLATLLDGLVGTTVSDSENIARPLTTAGVRASGFADRVLFSLDAYPGDVLSVAGMLICTNDGVVAADSLAFPASGSETFDLSGYDVGVETNTELSEDIVDACSALGPIPLDGDDNGNDNSDAEAGVVAMHPGVVGTAGGLADTHDWDEPVASLEVVALVDSFSDDDGSVHEDAINLIAAVEITVGCDVGSFCPDDSLSRAQMASLLARALGLADGTTDAFMDDDGSVHEGAINALAEAGITTGCAVGQFCPDDSVTRAQLATFLVNAMAYADGAEAFSDDNGSVHEDAINALAAAGITLGCDTDLFCPNDSVTRAQAASFIARALRG